MSPTRTQEALHRDLSAVAAALADAGAQADAGALVELSGLDERVAALCAAVEALPREEGRALLTELESIIAALTALASTLARQRDLAAGEETHTARQRAAAVYRRPPQTEEG
ncbi:MAG TPA: hypothetical protein VD978_20840 [Azospirillum sp.]|nr:hypothetical protein [Azospirillum sp.]